jgi:ACS family sodium-dependent inorganic phosphate cotransporter
MFGGEMLLVLAMVLWSAMTAATPHAATLGNWPVLAARVLLGAGEGLALPAIHSMIKKYVVPADRATSAAVITAASTLPFVHARGARRAQNPDWRRRSFAGGRPALG